MDTGKNMQIFFPKISVYCGTKRKWRNYNNLKKNCIAMYKAFHIARIPFKFFEAKSEQNWIIYDLIGLEQG